MKYGKWKTGHYSIMLAPINVKVVIRKISIFQITTLLWFPQHFWSLVIIFLNSEMVVYDFFVCPKIIGRGVISRDGMTSYKHCKTAFFFLLNGSFTYISIKAQLNYSVLSTRGLAFLCQQEVFKTQYSFLLVGWSLLISHILYN